MNTHIAIFHCKTLARVTIAAATLAAVMPWAHAGTVDAFKTGTDLTLSTNYNSAPGTGSDVTLTTSSTALTLNSNLAIESLSSAGTTSYTISNAATGTSTLTLGNATAFTNANDNAANDLIDLAGTKNLTLTGTGASSGTLGLVLASSGNFDVTGTGTLTISSNITESSGGAKTLTFDGSGTSVLSGTNTFSGGLVITAGEVDVSGDASLGMVPTSAPTADITLNGGRLGSTSNAIFTINANRTILLGSAAGTSISVKGTGDITYNGSLQDLSTGGVLVKQGGGILDLGGVNNSYTGSTSINNGTLRLDGANLLPTGTVVNIGQSASTNLGTFDLNGNNQTIAGLVSTLGTATTTATNLVTSAGTATLTINTASGTSYLYSGGTAANSGVVSGAISLVKTGTGTQALGGANTYTGTTTVNGGALLLSNTTGSATGTGAVTVNASGSLLGTGFISAGANAVTINGTLSPGAGTGSAGTINIASTAVVGALTLNSTSSLAFDITSTTSKDLVALGGSSLALNGGTLALNLPNTSSTGINYGSTYAIFTGVSGTVTGTGFGSVTGYDTTDYTAKLALNGTEYDLSFTAMGAVPEPATVAGGVLMVMALGWSQRRRVSAKARA